MEQREGRPLLLIDIAVPRDIDPAVRDLPGVGLYDMDDLQREVARNMTGREAEAARARTLVEDEVERFARWLATLDVVPTVSALHARGAAIADQALRENEGRWESLSEADRERVALLARAVVSRLLHEPTTRIKRAADDAGAYVRLQAVRELFGLDPEAADAAEEAEPAPAAVTSLESRRAARRDAAPGR